MSHSSPTQAPTIFQNPYFRSILLSGAFLQFGIWVRNFAVLLFVMDQTNNNPYAVSLISVAQFAPIFLFSFIGGTFADRWRPKRTMVASDLLSALSIFLVLLALTFGSWKAIFFATLCSATLSQFSQPSSMKLLKLHVPEAQLQSGMAIFQTLMAVFMTIGPAIGTLIYQSFGIQVAIAVMGAAFLLSAFVLFRLPPDQMEKKEAVTTNFWTEFAAGFRYVWSNLTLRSLGAVFGCIGLASGLIQPLFIFLVVERLQLPKESMQWLMMINGAGMLIGGVMIMKLAKRLAPHHLIATGLLVSAIGTFGNSLSTSMWAVMIIQLINGLVFPSMHIGINTLLLKTSEASFVGRVNGFLTPLFMGMMVIAMSMAGWLKTLFSLPILFGSAGLLFAISSLFLLPIFKQKAAVAKASS
ncbi:MFS transporter [Brevibacillus sp. 179-C9.3 HS]|uniref:MFS transporter n=1 Tax=unclassified Brevibacillus TaxID=2684853 RepID=UPI0039A33553